MLYMYSFLLTYRTVDIDNGTDVPSEVETIRDIGNIFDRLRDIQFLDDHAKASDYVDVDHLVETTHVLNLQEIAQEVRASEPGTSATNSVEDDDGDEDEPAPTPTAKEAIGACTTLQRYLESMDLPNFEELLICMNKVESAVLNAAVVKKTQKRVTDYFSSL